MYPLPLARPGHPARAGLRAASVVVATACLLAGGAGLAVADPSPSPSASSVATAFSGIILGVGADESQRVVSWYTTADTSQLVQLAPTASVVNGVFPDSAVTIAATGSQNVAAADGWNRHATLTGLRESTSYSYRVGEQGNWSTAYSFKTQSFEGDYDFLFFGDPQIGSSGDVPKDQAGWADTLNVALTANPNAELLVSGGDQVDTANNETQWNAFLSPDQLRQVPWAATIGNHDVGARNYQQHFYTPNTDYSAGYYANGQPSSATSGGDYWYIYKDVLFIDLNSNSYATSQGGGGDAAHLAYVTQVIHDHGAQAKYKVLVYHHAIYSPADHAKDADNKVRRTDFPTTFSQLGVDLVLQGHDHSYSRSYEIKNGVKANPAEQPGQSDVFVGEGGVIYLTANSSSGSKYYDLTAPDNTDTSGAGNGADPLNPSNYWYNSVENQEHVRTYTKVEVRNDQLVVQTLRSGTCDAPNAAVQVKKVSWCGPNNGTSPAQAVGTVVDAVTIHPYHGNSAESIGVAVPALAPGQFGWTIDGTNRLVDLGTATEQNQAYFQAGGTLNSVTVTDTRGAKAPWSVTAQTSDFTDGTKTIAGKYLGWTPKIAQAGAGAVAADQVPSGYDSGDGLSVSRLLGSAAQGHTRGSAQLTADLDLKVPSDTAASGTYRSTLTLTALAG